MFENVARALEAGDQTGARSALARSLGDFFTQSFVAGRAEHPVLGPEGLRLVEALQKIAKSVAFDNAQSHYVNEILHELGTRIVRREGRDAVVFLFNHALHLILPEYPLLVSDSLENARAELAARLQDDGTGFANSLIPARSALLIMAAARAFEGLDNARLSSIQEMTLGALDASEGVIPDLPVIDGIEEDDLVFGCPSCSGRRRANVRSAGDSYGCDCGAWTRVPIPGLARLATWLKAKRDKARGLSRCRICGAVIQTGRSGVMRAGFCSAICAKKGREEFGEHVALPARQEGERIGFTCFCGSRMEASTSAVGTKVPCAACGLEVWVPEPEAKRGQPTLVPCPKCGHVMKSTAPKCIYCGTPRP